MRLVPILLLASLPFAGSATAQTPVVNPGFEQGDPGAVPPGWLAPPATLKAGFGVQVTDRDCRTGTHCALMTGTLNPPPNTFGNLMQSVPAEGYTRHRIRLRAAIRVEGEKTRAQMWLRLDRADGSMAFLENMGSRPVLSSQWKTYDIETNVPADVNSVVLGVILFGPGSAWVDDVSLENLHEIHADRLDPPMALSPQGLTNLTAFAKLYGYVRFFHPSDQAEENDWDTFAIEGVRKTETASTNAELIARLTDLFHPIAPTVRIFPSGNPPPAAAIPAGAKTVRYKHIGIGLPSTTIPNNIYKSQRVFEPSTGAPEKPFEAQLVPGVNASIPVSLHADDEGTLPHIPMPAAPEAMDRLASDRGTRLADVVIAWNVFQHFYPYFDVVKTDWSSELPKALLGAATDRGPEDFDNTLRRLVAALHDGHGNVISPQAKYFMVAPVTLDWVAGQFIVTRAQPQTSVAPGDRVLKIDGKPIDRAAKEVRALISGATEQWIRYRSVAELSKCNPVTQKMSLELEPFAKPGTSFTADLTCVRPTYKDAATYTEPRPDKIAEPEPGIVYVDLDRVTEADWPALVPRLEKAKGIIFDMRGYPGQPGIQALAHLTDTTIRSAKWNVASAALPDRLDSPYTQSGWDVQPEKPYFSARRVFLTDGRAISYAETVMGIVEAFKLGEIVGEPTAGTNGNVNPFKLPDGYTLFWTGMKVLKHDGSQHHGIGILPTVPVSRTRKGVAEGKDEIFLRGLEVVRP